MFGNDTMSMANKSSMAMNHHTTAAMKGHHTMGMSHHTMGMAQHTMGMGHHPTMDPMSHHQGHNGTVVHHMMQMYFMLGDKVTILFKQWATRNMGELIASCFALFVLSVMYEGLKVFRQILINRAENQAANAYTNAADGVNEKSNNPPPRYRNGLGDAVIQIIPPRQKIRSLSHITQSFLHMLQVFIGYILMLAVMTFNCWICVAIIVGSGIGYFLFGWKTTSLTWPGAERRPTCYYTEVPESFKLHIKGPNGIISNSPIPGREKGSNEDMTTS